MPGPLVIGIDLGTSNCAVAFADLAEGPSAVVTDVPIPQLLRPGEVSPQALLPSCLYLPAEHEFPPGATRLPWGESPALITGEFARWQGGQVPGRLIASAKSWLCHPGVDRAAPILPWGAPAEVAKMSPVDASAALLRHMAAAWDAAHPDALLADQEVVVTVPASFDEVARALTVTAAQRAGLQKFTLLEEPQAAFYDFTSRHRRELEEVLGETRLILVVDVGGGTTDFTLIQVEMEAEGPRLQRLAVGDHLMLGGDNMDAALAHLAEERLVSPRGKLRASQWTQLLQGTRSAKESLLGQNPPEQYALAIAGEGSRLLGSTLTAVITRRDSEQVILDGFFPDGRADETPRRTARTALQELGLPYAQDPAVTRHLAAFLAQHAAAGRSALRAELPSAVPNSPDQLPRPDAILLNGGVFISEEISRRLVDVLSSWWPEAPRIKVLPHGSLSCAVARGAAYYGLVRHGQGRRIRGGAAHALYIGLAGAKGSTTPRAVCLVPRGQEEGRPVDLTSQTFRLTLGRPVQFPLFSTTSDRADRAGDLVEIDSAFNALPPLHTLFKGSGSQPTAVPVHLQALLTELGTLELWCVANESSERWRLEFEMRGTTLRTAPTVVESMPARFADARTLVENVFGAKTGGGDPRDARQLFAALERTIGPRETWRVPLLRELWGAVFAGAKRRRRSMDHERVFHQLAGYCLRPGFGYPLDEWRCEQTFGLFNEAVIHRTEARVWNEFWVLWRRIAGGLSEGRQQELWEYLKPHLAHSIPLTPPKSLSRTKGAPPEGRTEMVRVAASLEHLEPGEKIALGSWIGERLKSSEARAGPWAWALGRLGARVPLYGSGHRTVPPDEVTLWVSLLLQLGLSAVENAAFAVTQLARLTGDRSRDLDEDIRSRVVDALRATAAPDHWLLMVTEVVQLEAAEEARAMGDSLPIGLQLR